MIPSGEVISILGFGSYFNGGEYRDIDILVLHDHLDRASCNGAIWCKRRILTELSGAHVTMLAKSEERGLGFISKANARAIGQIRPATADTDLGVIMAIIRKR